MSAQLDDRPGYRPMRLDDLDAVMAIENDVYPFPWTRGNFADSIAAGYDCWLLTRAGRPVGYGVLMIGVDESHLLNLTIAAAWQRQGLGRMLLDHFTRVQLHGLGAFPEFVEISCELLRIHFSPSLEVPFLPRRAARLAIPYLSGSLLSASLVLTWAVWPRAQVAPY